MTQWINLDVTISHLHKIVISSVVAISLMASVYDRSNMEVWFYFLVCGYSQKPPCANPGYAPDNVIKSLKRIYTELDTPSLSTADVMNTVFPEVENLAEF